MNHWYSNGKIMLTGEYAVLQGATALAVPVKFGQSLTINHFPGDSQFTFETEVLGKKWFKADYDPENLEILNSTDNLRAKYLQSILKAAKQLNPLFLYNTRIINAKAQINFNTEWGLGSSSTLISNIAWWANVNPFDLNKLISKGSGYDIACARNDSPILYSISESKKTIQEVKYNPPYADQMFFIYLGKKQPTENNIQNFISDIIVSISDVYDISDLSHAFYSCRTSDELIRIINIHESIIGRIISVEPIKSRMFSNFKGTVKSLGAWGGDFCLAVTSENEQYVNSYFQNKGLETIFKYNDLRLTN